ncbi:MAG TPA: adenylyltransferase/cytidyltransferase family protein [Candidatus Methylacidiphilales bacterium]|nr:adenylyltransferase/cytidyltransferase family protein [Candidatus Methylacidiphilales bacterium]
MTSVRQKILSFEEAPKVFDQLRSQGLTIVQCHGTFDLLHPGHFYHLEEAKALGDVLAVTVTAGKYVNKGPGRPYFNDHLRAKSLAALACVDYVVIVPYTAAVEAIECIKPAIYCKGHEYADPESDVTGNFQDDLKTVEKFGGKVAYVGSVVFSSSKLLNKHLDHLPERIKDFCRDLSLSCSPEKFRDAVDAFGDLKVLLIGDIIFDRYSYVKVQGLTSKASIVSTRYLYDELQPGGTIAVYRHLKQFTPHVKMISLAGTEDWSRAELRKYLTEGDDLIVHDPHFTTIIKHRYVSPLSEGKELIKYFSVNYIDDQPPGDAQINSLLKEIEREIGLADLVVVADFGHGVMQKAVRDFVQAKARFLALNCQTNSNNHGFNIINRQYHRVNCFSIDQTEILLATGRRHIDFRGELEQLKETFSSDYAWLTRGSVETIGLKTGEKPCACLPFEAEVTDTVGAGDAFFSVAALAAYKNYSNPLATFMGQLAGAQAVKTVGNTRPISKAVLLKSGMSLLKF